MRCVVLFLVLRCAGDVSAQTIVVERVAWLQGCWRSVNGQVTIEEQWMAPRGGTMLGMGRTVRGGQTTEYELVLIAVKDNRLVYEAHPSGQKPATFAAASASDTGVLFENTEHDFPQRVGYRRDGGDGLQAWIEGQINGTPRRVDFSYRRVRCDAP